MYIRTHVHNLYYIQYIMYNVLWEFLLMPHKCTCRYSMYGLQTHVYVHIIISVELGLVGTVECMYRCGILTLWGNMQQSS